MSGENYMYAIVKVKESKSEAGYNKLYSSFFTLKNTKKKKGYICKNKFRITAVPTQNCN